MSQFFTCKGGRKKKHGVQGLRVFLLWAAMAKFNQIQKARRATIQDRKRAAHGDPHTRKLKQKVEPIPISGKRKRKLFNKWRREKKAAIENGLVTIEDVEMSVADGTSEVAKEKTKSKFGIKKASRLRIKRLKAVGRGKKKASDRSNDDASTDAMIE